MAKLSSFILEYKDVIASTGITTGDYSPPQKTVRRFIRLFKQIDDRRAAGMIDYPLVEIVLIAFLAILSNASTWEDIEDFGRAKEKWLKKFLDLKNGIPSTDTFRRVFAIIDPAQMEAITVSFLMENMKSIKKSLNIKGSGPRLICVDGKEEKGTGRKYGTDDETRNLQTLHVYDASSEICLFSRTINEKTNEIPVAQEVLKTLQLKDCIVSFDALHTQKDTIEVIVGQKGDYVGALKGNQGGLQGIAEAIFTDDAKAEIELDGTNYFESSEKAHGQVEIRRFFMHKARQPYDKQPWRKLRNFTCYEKYICDITTGKEKTEVRYYITSLSDVELCAEAIRGHWSVENKLHWHLDYSFGEDDNTTMDKNAFNNFSLLNKLALSLHKLAKPLMRNRSIRIIRKRFSWATEESMSLLLNTFDEDILKNALENALKTQK